jgi:multiple sugar transport system permease protein
MYMFIFTSHAKVQIHMISTENETPSSFIAQDASRSVMLRNLILGLALLLPLLIIGMQNRLIPAFDTINTSQMNVNALRGQADYVGMANYQMVLEDAAFTQTLTYTLSVAVTRVAIVALIPVILGLFSGRQARPGRIITRILISVVFALASPAVLAIFWSVYWGPTWGTDPSPIFPPPENFMLNSPVGAVSSTLILDALITLGIALGVGVTAFMAVARGRHSGSASWAAIGVWLTGIVLAGASAMQAFIVPFMVTAGGPARRTSSLVYGLYTNGFQNFRFGPGAVYGTFLIIAAVLAALLVWLALLIFRLRIDYVPRAKSTEAGPGLSWISNLLVILASLPLLALVGWALALAGSADSAAADRLNWFGALQNTLLPPLIAIWLVQIPATYLAGLALGLLRPFGRLGSNLLFLFLLIITFIPVEAITLEWFTIIRNEGMVNTLDALRMPWLVSAGALIVFKLYFDGAFTAYEQARLNGTETGPTMMNRVFVPSIGLALVVGAAVSLASTHSLWWPLIAISDRSLFTLPMQLVAQRTAFSVNTAQLVSTAVSYLLQVALIAAPIFVLLQIFVLDRLAIVAGETEPQS